MKEMDLCLVGLMPYLQQVTSLASMEVSWGERWGYAAESTGSNLQTQLTLSVSVLHVEQSVIYVLSVLVIQKFLLDQSFK